MSLETMIGSWTREEKLTAMDLIWQDLSTEPESFVSPGWHARVIASRLETPSPERALTLAEAKVEIKEAIDARRASD